MVAVVLRAKCWLPVSWPLLCLAIQFSSNALNSSFLFASVVVGVVAGDPWGQGKWATQKKVGHTSTVPGYWPPRIEQGELGLSQATQSGSCCHRNQCWAEWVAWFCNPFLFLSKSLLEMHCLLVSFVLIKIQTVVKKMLPTSRQLAFQANDTLPVDWQSGWISPDLRPGPFSSSPVLTGHQGPCQAETGRLICIPMLLGRASREGPQDSRAVSGDREGLLPQLRAPFLLSLPGPFSAGLLASPLSILQGWMPQCKGKIEEKPKKKQKKTPKAWDFYCFLISQLEFIRVPQKSEAWGLCCPAVKSLKQLTGCFYLF